MGCQDSVSSPRIFMSKISLTNPTNPYHKESQSTVYHLATSSKNPKPWSPVESIGLTYWVSLIKAFLLVVMTRGLMGWSSRSLHCSSQLVRLLPIWSSSKASLIKCTSIGLLRYGQQAGSGQVNCHRSGMSSMRLFTTTRCLEHWHLNLLKQVPLTFDKR